MNWNTIVNFFSKISMTNWISVITILFTFLGIFISNYLGRKVTFEQYKQKNKEKIYFSYYVPLIKKMYQFNIKVLDEKHLYVLFKGHNFESNDDFIRDLVHNNIQYVTPEIASLYSKYWSPSIEGPAFYIHSGTFDERAYNHFEQQALKANKYCFLIVRQSLKEARSISKELGLPNISKPLLEALTSNDTANK